ncbi:MAG: AAA family ATPase [Proteobacteria bacterium]|nr:AAA family ATPase [Pseudomonadota bacterium]
MSDALAAGRGAAAWSGDQAAGLRRLFGGRSPQVVAFASGHEACGRTTLLVQTAAALAKAGQGVLIIDENPAPNNAISAFGLTARHDLFQVLQGERTLYQTLLQAAPMVQVMPAARAARELDHASRIAAAARRNLAACLLEMQQDVEFVLVDTAMRRGGHLSPLALAARHMAIVVAAQGAAITHAYALIKRIAQERGRDGFQIVITRARNREEARAIFDNMRRVAHEHLDVRLDYLGCSLVPVTENLADALLQCLPPTLVEANDICNGFTLPAAGLARGGRMRRGQSLRVASDGAAELDSVV